jgi:hypothetical protein
MGMGTLILKKTTEYASSKMAMDINGEDHVGIFKSIMFYRIDEAEGLSFLKDGRVTYVTEQKVIVIL